MEVTEHVRLEVFDASGSGDARRSAAALAVNLGFAEHDVERVRLVATELTTNLVKHAGGGELLLRTLRANGARGFGMLALDRGPGVASFAEALRDGHSSAGSPGTGLGAIRRLSSVFDVYSVPGAGAAILAMIWASPPADDRSGIIAGGINVPYPGETVSGDAWAHHAAPGRSVVLVADGLGHGLLAAEASNAAVETFRRHVGLGPKELLERVHERLRGTRGGAVAVAEIDSDRGLVRFSGIGNVVGTILSDGKTRSVVSTHGTAGHEVKRLQEFQYPWPRGAVLVMHTDGLVSHWTLDRHPGLTVRHPMLVAGVLYRDFRRGRDDASVVVLREA